MPYTKGAFKTLSLRALFTLHRPLVQMMTLLHKILVKILRAQLSMKCVSTYVPDQANILFFCLDLHDRKERRKFKNKYYSCKPPSESLFVTFFSKKLVSALKSFYFPKRIKSCKNIFHIEDFIFAQSYICGNMFLTFKFFGRLKLAKSSVQTIESQKINLYELRDRNTKRKCGK